MVIFRSKKGSASQNVLETPAKDNEEQERQCRYNVTLRGIRLLTVAMETKRCVVFTTALRTSLPTVWKAPRSSCTVLTDFN